MEKKRIKSLAGILVVFGLSGCFETRIIVVPAGKPVLLAQDLENIDIMTKDKDGNIVKGHIAHLSCEGWILAPLEDKGNN